MQGYELEVIRGGARVLEHVCAIESELTLVPLYAGQPLLAEVVDELRRLDFVLVALEPEFSDAATGEILQMNGFFARA